MGKLKRNLLYLSVTVAMVVGFLPAVIPAQQVLAQTGPTFSEATFYGGGGDQEGTGIAVSDGVVYVSGNVQPETQSPSDTALLLKYAIPDLASLVWSRTFGSGSNFFGIAATNEGVYASGYSYSLTNDPVGGKEVKTLLAKFRPDGTDGPGTGGSLWATGGPGNLGPLFVYSGGEFFRGAATAVEDGSTFIYAAGHGQPASYQAYIIAKYDTSGNFLGGATDSSVGVNFTQSYIPSAGSSGASGVTILNGNIYVVGGSNWSHEDSSPRPAIWKYDPSLNLTWRQKDTSLTGDFKGVTAFENAIYAVGNTYQPGVTGSEDYLIQKYDEAGTLLWSQTSGGTDTDVLTGVVGIGTRLFAVGYTKSSGSGGADAVILEIDPATGNTLSTTLYGGAEDDMANGVATDGTDIYVVGESKSFANAGNTVGQNDLMLLRYTTGVPVALTIQALVDAASPGDTVIVGDGTYIENVNVDKSLTIQSENGANSNIVQAANPDDHVFEVTADNVTISGFTVSGATGQYMAGIYLEEGVDQCTISNNIISGNHRGIVLYYSNNNTIVGDNISSITMTVGGTGYLGIGIILDHATTNNIKQNVIGSNTGYGIHVYFSTYNNILGNDISNNYKGIVMNRGSNNILSANNISSSTSSAICLEGASNVNNTLYLNNFINSTNFWMAPDSSNTWNSPETITYSYGGNTFTSYLGNYWSNYSGADSNNDGVGDTPYIMPDCFGEDRDSDNYPLIAAFENYETVSAGTKDWTFMVYMAADNDLDLAGVDDLNEMEVAGSTDNVSIVALLDRYGSGNTKLYYVTSDSDTDSITSTVLEGPFGTEVNMGDPDTLVTFVEWTMANYPANHYALVMWDHGSGWRIRRVREAPIKGVCFDDTDLDYISTPELGTALSQINTSTGVTLDIIGFDACLMQMAEVASEINVYGNIMVGSEEVEPIDGWPYDTILTDLIGAPTSTPETLATTIVNQYMAFYGTSDIETMSAIDMTLFQGLEDAIHSFANSMVSSAEWENIVIARMVTDFFYDPDYMDLYDFARRAKTWVIDTAVSGNATAVMNAITNAMIAEGHGDYHDVHGVSIYFPTSGTLDTAYSDLAFASGTWDEFLVQFLSSYVTPQPPTWTETITDPTDDQEQGVGPDIVGLDEYRSDNVRIAGRVRTNQAIDFNNFYGMTYLDTDQNPETGVSAWGLGIDYGIYVSSGTGGSGGSDSLLPKLDIKVRQNGEPWALLMKWLAPDSWEYIAWLPLFTDSTSYWTIVPLSLLGPDDGNMDVSQVVGTLTPYQWTDMAPNPPIDWWQLIDDPEGDGPPDIVGVDAFRHPTKVGFRIRGTFDFGNLTAVIYLDTDQNPDTGFWDETLTNDIGADYYVNIIGTTSIEATLGRWIGIGWEIGPSVIINTGSEQGKDFFWFEIPLSQLGNDQGNMDVVQTVNTVPGIVPFIDKAPDDGHRTIGEPPWAELFSDATEGGNPDIAGVDIFRCRNSTWIQFRVRANGIDFANLWGETYFDVDQNNTSGLAINGIGADFLARISSTGGSMPLLGGSLSSWNGTDWEYVGGIGVLNDGDYYWFGFDYERDCGDNDGNMDVVQVIGTLSPEVETDRAPDTTYGTIAPRASVEDAITDGIAWLAAQQNEDGSWGTQYPLAKTALAVLKLETHATSANISPFDPAYEYHAEVEAGLNYIFANAYTTDISVQPAGDPDTNGNGIGVYFYIPGEGHDGGVGFPIYNTSMVMMVIAASNATDRVVNVSGSAVDGWTYEQVLQDAVDYIAWAQTDTGYGRGGWNYEPMNNGGDRSDQSNSGWVTLGLAYAESPPPLGFSLTIPGFVRTELDIWIEYIQNDVNGDEHDGGSDYDGPGGGHQLWVNILKTGNLLQQMAFVGDTENTTRVQDAIDYLVRHWNDANSEPGWRGCLTNYHATYTVMKGLEAFGTDNITSSDNNTTIDWFQDFVDALLFEQNPYGSWPRSNFDDGEGILSSEWALLTLQKTTVPTIEKPDLVISEKLEVWLDEAAETYRVLFMVKNRGNAATMVETLIVEITIDGELSGPLVYAIPQLAPGESSGLMSQPIVLTSDRDEITVCVDYTNVIDELNEDNNCRTNTWPSVIPGDANGDGNVNALDITKVERIIAGLDAPTPGADANQDCDINALDITKVERIIAGLD